MTKQDNNLLSQHFVKQVFLPDPTLAAAHKRLVDPDTGIEYVTDGTEWLTVGGVMYGPWQAVTLASGWTPVASTPALRFRKELGGTQVHIIGVAKGANSTVAFTLPTGFRPLISTYRPFLTSGGTGYAVIGTDGTVIPVQLSGDITGGAFFDTTIPLD